MRDTPAVPALDDPISEALVRSRRFFTKGIVSDDLRTLTKSGVARPTTSTATGGATTRSSAPPTA